MNIKTESGTYVRSGEVTVPGWRPKAERIQSVEVVRFERVGRGYHSVTLGRTLAYEVNDGKIEFDCVSYSPIRDDTPEEKRDPDAGTWLMVHRVDPFYPVAAPVVWDSPA